MPTKNLEPAFESETRAGAGPAAVHVLGLGTAVPPFRATQKELLDFVLSHFDIRENTRELYKKTFADPSIHKRHLAVHDLSDVLDRDHDRINARFEKWAVKLSTESLQKALAQAGLAA